MKRTMALLLFLSIVPALCEAATVEPIQVSIKGMVCAFCAQGVKSMLESQEAVKQVHVDLDKSAAYITLKDGAKMDDQTIKKLITDSGYEVTAVIRPKPPAPPRPTTNKHRKKTSR